MAVVSVLDNGDGIPNSYLDHLFDGSIALSGPQSSDRTRRLGIGLSVCRAIIQAHGGTISARNNPEGGACFSFTLPLGGQYDENP